MADTASVAAATASQTLDLQGCAPPGEPSRGSQRMWEWGQAFLSYLCLQPLQVMVTRPVPLGTQAMRWHLGQRK